MQLRKLCLVEGSAIAVEPVEQASGGGIREALAHRRCRHERRSRDVEARVPKVDEVGELAAGSGQMRVRTVFDVDQEVADRRRRAHRRSERAPVSDIAPDSTAAAI
jgi:hypothetical protein